MEERSRLNVLKSARSLADACYVQASVYDYALRDFIKEMPCMCYTLCALFQRGGCDYKMAHRYGSFEAERWDGVYVYYCPASLTFISAVVFEKGRAAYSIILGPLVMGDIEDAALEPESALPKRSPEQVNHLLNVQRAVAMYLSGKEAEDDLFAREVQAELNNSLYAVTDQMRSGEKIAYPIAIERQLMKMIAQGDKQGASELINQLLGTLYFGATGDLESIKDRAGELIVLFSRASVEGGADAQRIFGKNRDLQREMDRITTLDELSRFLVSIFYRFVGYVFDFSQFEHADIIYKAMGYVRENLAQKLTLEEVALEVGLSRSYLSTVFNAELGLTFTEYLNRQRIEKSKQLLCDTSFSLAQIADLAGYNDQSYFTKMFTKQTGMSPSQFRKKRGRNVRER